MNILMSIWLALSLIFTPSVAYADTFQADITDDGIEVSGDIFGMHEMLPGDEYDSAITISNTTDENQKVYLFMDYKDSVTDSDKLFASMVDVTIVDGDDVYHDGTINQIISGDIPLIEVVLEPGDEKSVDIELKYRFDAHEDHANSLANIDWRLHSEVVGDITPDDPDDPVQDEPVGDNPNPTGSNKYSEVGKDESGKAAPQTGQAIAMCVVGVLGVVAVIIAICMIRKKKEQD